MNDKDRALLTALLDGPEFGLRLTERVPGLGMRIYPLLRALEDAGLLRSWDGETTPERNGRPRRYYALTPAGRSALKEAETS